MMQMFSASVVRDFTCLSCWLLFEFIYKAAFCVLFVDLILADYLYFYLKTPNNCDTDILQQI